MLLTNLINELSPAGSLNEGRMSQERCQERDIGFYSPDPEFYQGTEHLAASNLVRRTMAGTFDQPMNMSAGGPEFTGNGVQYSES